MNISSRSTRFFDNSTFSAHWLFVFLLVTMIVISGCAEQSAETRPFFQKEYDRQSHGRKTLFDHIVEIDPGEFDVKLAPSYSANPPARLAVLPFSDVGSANFVLDKIPLTFRNRKQRYNWAWTDSQRLRRNMQGYLSEREFKTVNLDGIDAVLKSRGITDPRKLARVSPQQLGEWFGADAVVYGTVESYEAYYFGLVAAWRVGVKVRIVSTRTGKTLVKATGSRFNTSLLVALTPMDIAINSAENILQLRDIVLARSEDETCREIVRRIPISSALKKRDENAALEYADHPDVYPMSDPTLFGYSPYLGLWYSPPGAGL